MILRLLEALIGVAALGITGVLGVGGYLGWFKRKQELPPTAPDNCKHRRWTPWVVVNKTDIHLYSELDEGKGLPDRVDAQLSRTCISCGLPQYKTVRGIDSQHYK
jgi:hypothetical protein